MIIKPAPKLKKIDDEMWLVVPDTNNCYYVSNYGRVRSFAYDKKNGKYLKFSTIKGYYQLQITVNRVRRRYYVHKLVAQLWLECPSEEHKYVTHLNGIKTNNHVSNLKWITYEEALDVSRKVNRNHNRTANHFKLEEREVKVLKSMLLKGVPQVYIAKVFGISEMQVTRIKRGENWGHVKA